MSVCALLFILLLHEDQPAPQSQSVKIEATILVTATRSERAVSELPVSATVVTEEEIRSAPVRSVDDLVRSIPGVHMSILSGSGSTPNNQRLSMHGLGGTRALVLLDGVPLHDPYSGVVQWQKAPLESLRQIEVVRGGNTSLFGSFALGGTINLITRPVDHNEIAADLSYGSHSTERKIVSVDQVLSDKLAVRVSHHRNESNGFSRVPNPGPIDVPAWTDNWITAGRVDLRLSETSSVFAKTSMAQVDVSQGTPLSYSKRDILESSVGLNRAVRANGLLSASAFYQRQKERLVNSTISSARDSELVTQDGLIPSNVAGGSLEWSMQRRGAISFVSVGVDVRKTEAAESRVTFNRNGAITQRNRVGGKQTLMGLFAQMSWQPADRLEILTSARLDTFRNEDGSDVIVGGATTEYPSSSSNQLDPRVSVRYGIGARSALRASVYRAFGAPTLRDLYRTNQSGTSLILGNPYLEPETLVGGEVGWEWASDRAHVEVNVYRSTIDGLQSRVQVAGQPGNVFRFVNVGAGRSQGVELMGSVRLSRRWSMNAGYTHADAVVTEDPNPELVGKWLIDVAPHIGSLSARWRGDRGTSVDVRGRVLSRSYADGANIAISPAHRVIDLSMSQSVRPWIDVYVTAENVLDEHYYAAFTTTSFRSGLPRTITGGVRVRSAR